MKTDLLTVVLEEDAGAFRAATRRQVVALARRRRRGRVFRRATGIASTVVVAALIWWRPADSPRREASASAPSGVAVVESRPLPTGMLMRTGDVPLPSGVFNGINLVRSRPLEISVVETRRAASAFKYWNDRQLLAAFPGRRAALVGLGTENARLIFY